MDDYRWLADLDGEARRRAERLIALFTRLGAPDPATWAHSEVGEGIPQVARFLVLRRLWVETIDRWRDDLGWVEAAVRDAAQDPGMLFADVGQALRRLLEAGADPADLGSVARMAAYASVFDVLNVIDEGYDPTGDDDLPGWKLVETDADGEPTGRHVGGLHEDILMLDPTGREGWPASPPDGDGDG